MKLVISVFLLVWSTGQTVAQSLNPRWSVTFPEGMARELAEAGQCAHRPVPSPINGSWMPNPEILDRVDALLGPALQDALNKFPAVRVSPQASDYYRQFAGLVIGRERVVYVNGFHRLVVELDEMLLGRSIGWRTGPMIGCKGGLSYFGTEYNVARDALGEIVFNARGDSFR